MVANEKKYKFKPTGWIKPTEIGTAHIPLILRNEVSNGEIPFILDANAALLFNPDKDLKDILASIEILKQDLKLRWEK